MNRNGTRPNKRAFVLSVCAQEGGGKTNFLLTAPRPLLICSIDINTEPVMEKVLKCAIDDLPADIAYHRFRMPNIAFIDKSDVKQQAEAEWIRLIDTLRPLVQGDSGFRTVALDTASEFDVLNVLAEFGKSDQISPESRRNRMGPVNKRWSGMIRALVDRNLNVVLTHRLKRRWESKEIHTMNGTEEQRSECTGPWEFDRVGHKETSYDNSVEIYLRHDPSRSAVVSRQFGGRIMRCTLRPSLIGKELWGSRTGDNGEGKIQLVSFPYLASLVYPQLQIGDFQ